MPATITTARPGTVYAPAAVVCAADYLACIITGTPYSEALRPPHPEPAPAFPTAQAGVEHIASGRAFGA